jgi:hypothetical protein
LPRQATINLWKIKLSKKQNRGIANKNAKQAADVNANADNELSTVSGSGRLFKSHLNRGTIVTHGSPILTASFPDCISIPW